MWFRSRSSVTCFYCNTTLSLVVPDRKGKGRQYEPTGLAHGTRDRFECGACGCVNVTGPDGQPSSDRAAFHDSALNTDSFSKRGSSRIRSGFSPTASRSRGVHPFCRQCLSNQSLQIHLLSSYPSCSSDEDEDNEDDASFPPLAEYRQSLDRRYPLVCENCRQNVEDIVRERDYRVKTAILGGRLNDTVRRRLQVETTPFDAAVWPIVGLAWRLRGLLWALNHVATIVLGLNGALDPVRPSQSLLPFDPLSVEILLLSPLWAFWDPTWDALRKERKKRGGLTRTKVVHRRRYVVLQAIALMSRCALSFVLRFDAIARLANPRLLHAILLITAITALLSTLKIPQLVSPPPILLKTTDSPSRPSTPRSTSFAATDATSAADDPLEPLQNLSLSKRTSILAPTRSSASPSSMTRYDGARDLRLRTRANETSSRIAPAAGGNDLERTKFGQTSFSTGSRDRQSSAVHSFPENLHAANASPVEMQLDPTLAEAESETSMDWAPTLDANGDRHNGNGSGGVWFKPRSFVVPDFKAPTGLESILERVGLKSDGETDREGEKMDVDAAHETPAGAAGWWKRWIGT